MKKNLIFLILLSILLFVGFGQVLDSYIDSGKVILFDQQVYQIIGSYRNLWLDKVIIFITLMGNWQIIGFSTVLGSTLLYAANKQRYLQALLLSVCSGLLFTEGMKILISRPRPPLIEAVIGQNGYSFPSGHSYFAVCFYGLITYFWVKHFRQKKYKILFLFLGISCCLLIGFSRIYLGVHWFSDVLGGFLSSGAWLAGTIAFLEYQNHYLKTEYKEFNRKLVWRGFWVFTILWLAGISLLFSFQR